jgi:hypothetical protein
VYASLQIMTLLKLFLFQYRLNILTVELCAIDILLDNTKLRLFVCYRPPSSNNDIDAIRYVKDLCDCIDCVYPNNFPVVICGDLNFPYIDRSTDNCSLCSNVTCSGVFLKFCYNHGLHQYVNLPPVRKYS